MFKALFLFIGFGCVAFGFWFVNPLFIVLGFAFIVFVIWWIRSTQRV